MTRIKRVAVLWLMVMLLLFAAMTVSAEEPTKTIDLQMNETSGTIVITPVDPTFWEYPQLRAGEDRVAGTMVVKNTGTRTASMVMEPVPLPYGDEQRMAYLDQLMLTVTEGDTVLYDNTYSHINDPEGGLHLSYEEMVPGEQHTYTIKLSCRYTYAGDVTMDAIAMPWQFSARTVTTTYEGPQGFPMWVWIMLGGLAATMAVLVIITIIRAVVRHIKRKKEVDNQEKV